MRVQAGRLQAVDAGLPADAPDHARPCLDGRLSSQCEAAIDRFGLHRERPRSQGPEPLRCFRSQIAHVNSGAGIVPQFDALESRIALSIDGIPGDAGTFAPTEGTTAEVGSQSQDAPLSVDLANPIPGSVLSASPVSLVLEFNRPILPDSLASDVEIVQTDSDGNLTWITGPRPAHPRRDGDTTLGRPSANSCPGRLSGSCLWLVRDQRQ